MTPPNAQAEVAHENEPLQGTDNASPRLRVPHHAKIRNVSGRHGSTYDADVESLLSSHLSKDERALHATTALGERLPYNAYATIDWLHDLVKDSLRHRRIHSRHGWRARVRMWWDGAESWVVAVLVGVLTALVAFVVDVSVATVSSWKEGVCGGRWWVDKEQCCAGLLEEDGYCKSWHPWSSSFSRAYAIYVGLALLYGIIAGSVTLTTRDSLPVAESDESEASANGNGVHLPSHTEDAKVMYMAAGSGIPEIKTILSGFVIPHFLDLKVLVVKAVGATFAVATGMCLGKEGPFVHISTCVGYLVATRFPKYRENARNMREMLSVACSAGLSVAFGAPIGGVLFSYEVCQAPFPSPQPT
jgi:chloride channel 3/4/5